MNGIQGLTSYNGFDSQGRALIGSQITPSGDFICRSLSVRDNNIYNYVNASINNDGDLDCHTVNCYEITINEVKWKAPVERIPLQCYSPTSNP